MNFELTQEQQMIKKMTQEFANDELLPDVVKRDIEKIWPKEQISKMADLGLLGMMVTPEWGGNGMDTISYAIAMEEISAVDAFIFFSKVFNLIRNDEINENK